MLNLEVSVLGTANEIRLVVTDRGTGFEVDRVKRGQGLGLVSMQERVNLVHGKLLIDSKLGQGTKVVAIVPLPNLAETLQIPRALLQARPPSGSPQRGSAQRLQRQMFNS